jgi:hypothetical protein
VGFFRAAYSFSVGGRDEPGKVPSTAPRTENEAEGLAPPTGRCAADRRRVARRTDHTAAWSRLAPQRENGWGVPNDCFLRSGALPSTIRRGSGYTPTAMSRRRHLTVPALLPLTVAACGTRRPVLASDESHNHTSEAVAQRNIDDCMRRGQQYVSSRDVIAR